MINSNELIRYKESIYTGLTKVGRISYSKDDNGKVSYTLSDGTEVKENYIIAHGDLTDVLREGDILIMNYGTCKTIENVSIGNVIYCFPDHPIQAGSPEVDLIAGILTKEQVDHYSFKMR